MCVIPNFANGAYISGNKRGEDEMGRARSMKWENRNAYKISALEIERDRPLRRPRRRWNLTFKCMFYR